jgi:dUTP pyrophosphatase
MTRGFEKVSLDEFRKSSGINPSVIEEIYNEIKLPHRSTKYSAGHDFYSPITFCLQPGESIQIATGIKSYMQKDEVLQIYIRSSIGFKYNVRLNNSVGIIDSDYFCNKTNEGHIHIKLTNHGNKEFILKQGEAIAQGIFVKFLVSDNDMPNNKRTGGIGSTNKKGESQ